MNRRSFIKGLIALASAPAIGKYVNVFKTEGARKGIENVASQGVDFFNSVIKKVMDEGTLVKEQDRTSVYKHPDRPDIMVEIDQGTGSSSVYFDTDQGSKAGAEIIKTMDETTKGRTVEELMESEEVYKMGGDEYYKDVEEGITGGITNLEEFLKRKKGFAMGGRVGMFRGGIPKGLQAAMQAIKKKFGNDSIKTVEETQDFGLPYFNIDRPEKAIARDKFKNFNKEGKFAEDGTPDYEYYADILNDSENTFVNGDETIEELEIMLKEREAYMGDMYDMYKTGKLDPVAGEKTEGRKRFLQDKLDEAEASGDNRLITRDEMDELESFDLSVDDIKMSVNDQIKQGVADVLSDTSPAGLKKSIEIDNLMLKYPGMTRDLAEQIASSSPRMKADMIAMVEQTFKMDEIGMSGDDIIQTFKNTTRTKQADGGIIGLTAMKIPDNSKSGVESLFKRR
jgi:hypothetical protein